MFDLEQALSEWRRQMLTAGIKSPATLEELESHLREEVELQMRSGTGAEQAFALAVRRIGRPAALQREFTKAGTAKIPRRQRLKGALLKFLGVTTPTLDEFTDGARESLEMGRKEALGFHHDFIGTEHVLLGLLELKTGVVPGVLRSMGLDHKIVRGEIERIVGNGPARSAGHTLPMTPRVKKALQLAGAEARAMRQTHVGAEHVLLGLLQEGSGVAAIILQTLGVDSRSARHAVLIEMGRNQGGV